MTLDSVGVLCYNEFIVKQTFFPYIGLRITPFSFVLISFLIPSLFTKNESHFYDSFFVIKIEYYTKVYRKMYGNTNNFMLYSKYLKVGETIR